MNVSKTFYLNIAGFNIQIDLKPTQWQFAYEKFAAEIKNYYQGFLVNKKTRLDYQIEIVETPAFLTKIERGHHFFINIFNKIPRKKIITYYQIGIFQFQIILREILVDLLSKNQGFIIHGSAVAKNNKAIIFTGKNGAGKSTAMNLLHPEFTALADDTVIIRCENKKFYLYQTPFIEKNHWIEKKSGRYLINNIFFLKKALFFRITVIKSKNYLLNRLTKQFWSSQENYQSQFKVLLQFVNRFNKFYFLYFAKDRKELIRLLTSF
jgi:hypothetical protein